MTISRAPSVTVASIGVSVRASWPVTPSIVAVTVTCPVRQVFSRPVVDTGARTGSELDQVATLPASTLPAWSLATAVSCTVSPSYGVGVGLVTVTLAVVPDTAVAVASKVTAGIPATVAVARFAPAAGPRVQRVLAVPAALVMLLAGARDPPPAVTAQATVTPATGCPDALVTDTLNAVGNSVPAAAVWLLPATRVTDVGVVEPPLLPPSPPPPPPHAVSTSAATAETTTQSTCDRMRIPPGCRPARQGSARNPRVGVCSMAEDDPGPCGWNRGCWQGRY